MDELTWKGLVTFESRIDRAIVGALRGHDLSGFEIWRWLGSEEGAAGLLTEADLYPTLYRLEAEGLLQSDWHEGERTRRMYRLTATALERAEENSWPALAFRGRPGPPSEPGRTGRLTSPDPETGSWFVPHKTEPVAAGQLSTASPARSTGDSEDENRPSDEPAPASSDGGDPRSPAIDRYADDLGAALDLPRIERNRVRQEIADHLADSASARELNGLDAQAATVEAIDHLGNFHDLATRIERAQHTLHRRDRAIRRGVIELVGEMVLWLALSVVVFAVAPGVSGLVTAFGRPGGLHLVVLRSAEWSTNQMAIMVCVGAFAAGRLSMGHVARISRHGDATLRRPWALGGAAAVLAVALLLPGYQDALVVVTLLAAPVAFVAGTLRPKHVNESSYTWRGIGAAVLVVVAITFLPAGRLFAYDPSGTPGTPPAPGKTPGEIVVNQNPNGTFEYSFQSTGAVVVTVELWPASTDGPFIAVDRFAAGPSIRNALAQTVDLAKLPPYRQWWVVAVTTGPNGGRTAVAVGIQVGVSPDPGTALSWLISHI